MSRKYRRGEEEGRPSEEEIKGGSSSTHRRTTEEETTEEEKRKGRAPWHGSRYHNQILNSVPKIQPFSPVPGPPSFPYKQPCRSGRSPVLEGRRHYRENPGASGPRTLCSRASRHQAGPEHSNSSLDRTREPVASRLHV
ncbi:unnamed protein product [Gadus morhua 'NCC']